MTISASDFYDVENIYYEEDEWFDDHSNELYENSHEKDLYYYEF